MSLALPSLVILISSAALTAEVLTKHLRWRLSMRRCDLWAMRGTLFFTICVICAQAAGAIAEITHRPWFRLPTVAAISLIACIMVWLRVGRKRQQRVVAVPQIVSVSSDRTRRRIFQWILAVPVIVLHALLACECLLRPPNGYDGLFYHLPLMGRWIHTGRLFEPAFGIPEYWHPANCELWQWFFASIGVESLIEFSMLPVGLFLAVVTYGLAREIGARPLGAWVVALFVISMPMLAMQTYSSYVDLFMLAYLLAGWLWLLKAFRAHNDGHDSARLTYGLLAGVSGGMVLGSKYTGLPWVVGLVVLYFGMRTWQTWRNGERAAGFARASALFMLIFIGGAALPSAAWFVRNTIHTGWPLYPMQIELAGIRVGTGFDWQLVQQAIQKHQSRAGWQAIGYPWFEWKQRGNIYSHGNGLGPAFATFAVMGLVYQLWSAWRKRRRQSERCIVNWAMIALIIGSAILWITLLNYHVRYAVPLWVAVFVASGPFVDWLLRRQPYAASGLLLVTIALACSMVGIYPANSILTRMEHGGFARSSFYGLPAGFDSLPPGTVILNLAEDRMNYPLMGEGFKYSVIECMNVWYNTIKLPLTQAQIDDHGIEVVFTRSNEPGQFAPGVRHTPLSSGNEDHQRVVPSMHRTFPRRPPPAQLAANPRLAMSTTH